jgi:hypothetical protein
MKFGFQVKQKTEEKSRVGEKDVIHMSKTLTTW